MGVLFIFCLIAAIVAVGVKFGRSKVDGLNRAWSVVAHKHNLALRPGTWKKPPMLEGAVEGFPLTVDIQHKGTGKSRTTWTRYKVDVDSLPHGLRLTQKGFMSRIARVFGAQDISVGDQVFDKQVLVKGNNVSKTRNFLTAARRQRVSAFLKAYSAGVIDAKGVSWLARGKVSDASAMLAAIGDVVSLAHSLSGDESLAHPQALPELPAEWELPPVIERRPVVEPPVVIDSPVAFEPSVAFEALPVPELAPVVTSNQATIAAGVAAVPALGAMAALLPEADDEPVAATATDAPIAADASGIASADDAAEFCNTLFASRSLGFEAARTFQERYQGQQVSWAGTLKSAERYGFDFVFGSGKGVKATLKIHTVETGALGNGDVKAVIQLPADTEGLDARIGEKLRFYGTLVKLDGFMRNVFLSDARLE